MRVLVTGGAGFIGGHIVETLHNRGIAVAALDDLSSGRCENIPADVHLYEVDVRNRADVDAVFADFRPTHVSHQAAQASVKVSVSEPARDAAINILGGIHVLEAARRTGVEKLVFASTGGAIYGEVPEGDRADESWDPKPKSPYAIAKRAFELYLAGYRESFGFRSTVLRYSNVYGPRQDPHGEAGVVAIFSERLLKQRPVSVFARREVGDPGCIRDYIYVSDVVSANIMALEAELEGTFNVATGVPHNTQDILDALQEALGTSATPQYGPMREGDLEVSVLDASSLSQHGWSAGTTLGDGIARTATWFTQKHAEG